MAITDYDFEKTLQATSFNDSGTTIGKAQPVILRGSDYTGIDGFESGSSQLGWESLANFSIDSNSEVYLNNSLQLTSTNESVGNDQTLDSVVSSDSSRILASVKIDNQTGNSSDSVQIGLVDGVTILTEVEFLGNGDITAGSGDTVVGSWSQGIIYDVEIVVDFTNDQYDLIVNGDILSTGLNFDSSGSDVDSIDLTNITTGSGGTVNAFFDRLTYTAPVEDSINAGGFVGYDSSTVADAQDVAFYDQNDNLLDYELENGGDLGSNSTEVTAWVYRSYTRDDSNQVKFAFGNNSANTDRQNVTGTWGNTGQNAVMVQHLEENNFPTDTALDSTVNDNDGSVTGATSTDGQFDGAANFDGTDDEILVNDSTSLDITGQLTVVSAITVGDSTKSGDQMMVAKDDDTNGRAYTFSWAMPDSSDGLKFYVNGGGSVGSNEIQAAIYPEDNTRQNVGAVWDNSGSDTATLYQDGSSVNSISGINQIPTSTAKLGIGSRTFDGAENFFNGTISEARLYNDAKSSQWFQADYDASPKAGQVFFTQDAATTTITSVTTTDSVTFTENTSSQLVDTLSDNLTLSENIRSQLIDTLKENLGFRENVASTYIDTLADSMAFSETLDITIALTVTVTDNLNFTEQTIDLLLDTISEQLTLQENIDSVYFDTLTDQLKIEEKTTVALAEVLTDNLQFQETESARLADVITEQIDFTENIESQLETTLQDSLQFSESVAGGIATTVSDQLQFTENTKIFIKEVIQEQLEFSEETATTLADALTDNLTLQEQVTFASLINIQGLTEAIITNKDRFVDMQNQTFKEGDLGDELNATLKDSDGAIDLSQVQKVDFVVKDRSETKVLDSQATITTAKDGKIEYVWQSGDFIETAGIYRAEFRITDSAGNTETVPNNGYVTIEIEEEIE